LVRPQILKSIDGDLPTVVKRIKPKKFDTEKFSAITKSLFKNMDGKEFEKRCEPIVMEILRKYEGFEKVVKGPNFRGTPFDFFGFRNDRPYMIEFKGSLDYYNSPDETEKRRLKEILERFEGLGVALLQVKLHDGVYRIFYDEDLSELFKGRKVPTEPIISWIEENIRR